MIIELGEQFFKVFEIEKKCQCKNFINYADCFRIPTECKEAIQVLEREYNQ